jgi:TRAP-type C4-dicarboxylate transport system permease small subunit
MQRILNKTYTVAGAIAGLCIVLICITILVRVIGRWFGIVIPSSDDFAGYLLAASSFLALAYSFRQGSHIRVTLFLHRLEMKSNILLERLVLVIASVLVTYLSYQLSYMVWESWIFEELTHGYIPLPLWWVQLPVAIGAIIFAISVIDTTVRHCCNQERIPKSEEEALAEAAPIDFSSQQGESK